MNTPEALSPEAISNRFLDATEKYTSMFLEATIASNPWAEKPEAKILRYMREHSCTRAKAKKIIKAEDAKRRKEYNSPLKVAERRIQELEAHLELIKDVIADPNYLDRFP